jgi:hypothetical protein
MSVQRIVGFNPVSESEFETHLVADGEINSPGLRDAPVARLFSRRHRAKQAGFGNPVAWRVQRRSELATRNRLTPNRIRHFIRLCAS